MKILQIRVGTIAETLKGKHARLCGGQGCSTLALKPRVDVTRSPKQAYQWPAKGHISSKKLKKKKIPFTIHIKILLTVQIQFLLFFQSHALFPRHECSHW